MTAFEKMERMFDGNVQRIADAINDSQCRSFAGYDPEQRSIRVGKTYESAYSYYSPLTSVVQMTEGKEGRIDALFERYKVVRVCDDGSVMHMRVGGAKHWYQGETACKRALKDAAEFMGVPPRFLQRIYEEVEE